MTAYHGKRHESGCQVWVTRTKDTRRLPPMTNLRNHSPTGFEWGYGGSGPAQLALALCYHATGSNKERALRIYQAFKFRVVGNFSHEEWTITREEVLRHIETLEREIGQALDASYMPSEV